MSGPVKVQGRPERLDAVLRPILFVVLGGSGLLGTLVLVWLGWWFWVPVPVAAGLLLHGGIFAIRGDRPITCTVEHGVLVAVDRKGGREHRVDLGQVVHAGLSVRQVDNASKNIVYVVLYDAHAPLLALRASTPRRAWPRHAAPLDALQPVLGGNAGVLRGLAPAERIVRQVLRDDDGDLVRALLARVPEAAWTRRPLRVWQGQAPPVDFMGLHQGPPDAILLLRDGDDGTPLLEVIDGPGPASPPTGTWPVTGHSGARSRRLLTLLSLPGQDDRVAALPMLVWDLTDAHRLAVPAPIAGHHGEAVDLDEHALHTHLGEAAGAAWWLLQRLDRVPDGLCQAISDARIATPRLHPTLARHLPVDAVDLAAAETAESEVSVLTGSDSPDRAPPGG